MTACFIVMDLLQCFFSTQNFSAKELNAMKHYDCANLKSNDLLINLCVTGFKLLAASSAY